MIDFSNAVPCYETEICLDSTDCDMFNRWKMSSIIKHMQQAGSVHSEIIGWGMNDLMEKFGVCLVLAQSYVKMNFLPPARTQIKLITWPDENSKTIITRYFSFRNLENGEIIGNGIMQCVLMNINTRSVARVGKDSGLHFPSNGNLVPEIKSMPRFIVPHSVLDSVNSNDFSGCVFMNEHRTVYGDYDYNGHVNNVRYVEWIFDLFDNAWYKDKSVNEFLIKYTKEVKPGNLVRLLSYENQNPEQPDESYYVLGKSDEINFQAFVSAEKQTLS